MMINKPKTPKINKSLKTLKTKHLNSYCSYSN